MTLDDQQFYYKNNRLQQLRGFCYAAQFGNISRAASFMGLTQSSVSLQIKALERDMGCQLFSRSGPKILLTEDGKKLLDLSLPLLDGIHNLRETFHHQAKVRVNTELRIAVNNTVKNYLLPPVLRDFLERNTEISVVVTYAEHEEAMRLIEDEAVDIALLPRREHLPFPRTYDYTPMYFCKPCLITLPTHPLAGRSNLSVDEILTYPLTLPAEDLRVIPNLYEVFARKQRVDPLRMSFVNAETGREYIEQGLLITISSDIWMRPNDTLAATPLSHLFPDVDYGMVRKRSKQMPQKVKKFLTVLQQHGIERTAKFHAA